MLRNPKGSSNYVLPMTAGKYPEVDVQHLAEN